MAAVHWDKDQRAKAKVEGLSLICIALDGESAKRDGMTFHAPVEKELADKVWNFMQEVYAEHLASIPDKKRKKAV